MSATALADNEGVSSPPDPPVNPPPPKRPTTLGAGSRDMLIAMLILLPIVGLVAFVSRGCSFSPGAATADPSAMPAVDAHQALTPIARHVAFPLREPALPPGWRANVVDERPGPDGAAAVRVGWITPAGRYLRLVQSPAEEGALVAAETGGPPSGARPVTVGGLTWVDYQGANGEAAWAHGADGVTWLITGDGIAPEFEVLASAVAAAPPLRQAG